MRGRFTLVFGLATLVCALDQLTKWLVVQSIAYHTSKTVIPDFFNLVHVMNKGSAFGFLNRGDIVWQRYFFLAASLVAIGIIVYMAKTTRLEARSHFLALGLLLGGAIGNLIDRARLGEVIDFLDVYVGDYHWPAFNVADSALTVGALLLIAVYYRHERKLPRPQDSGVKGT
jgi:signal peptidase II